MNFQDVVMKVADLDRSIDFYYEVLDFTLVSRKEQLAAMSAPGSDRDQIIVLRVLGRSPLSRSRPHRDASLHVGSRSGR